MTHAGTRHDGQKAAAVDEARGVRLPMSGAPLWGRSCFQSAVEMLADWLAEVTSSVADELVVVLAFSCFCCRDINSSLTNRSVAT